MPQVPSRTTRLRTAGGLLVTLGVGHLAIGTVARHHTIADWARRGLWSTVSIEMGTKTPPATESLIDVATYWSGIGSFAVPTAVLGALIIERAVHDEAVPAWAGWTIGTWCAVAGVILEPAPWPLGVVAGALVAGAADRS